MAIMTKRFLIRAVLLIVSVFSSQGLLAQSSYPIQGQPQGGDRRGSYYYEDEEAQRVFEDTGAIPRLYADPKIYIHNMTLLAHVPGRFNHGEMMTIAGNRYVVVSGVI